MSSTTPLLFLNPPTRKDYLDNLRCTLTILLVLHHATFETAVTTEYSTAVAMFITMQKTFLWSLFFFVSGYSMSLSQVSRATTLGNYVKKGVKVTLPALAYAVIGQWTLFTLLSTGWPDIFGKQNNTQAYARFSGPVPYVLLLLLFDSSAVVIRQLAFPPWVYPSLSPNHITVLGFIILTGYTFLNAAFVSPLFSIPSFLSFLVYDMPDVCFPVSHIMAYWAGWQFKTLKRSILAPSSRIALSRLLTSSLVSFTSLYYAQLHWKPLARLLHTQLSNEQKTIFIDGGLNGHTIAFAFWSSFTYFTISVSLISTFFHVTWTSSKWGWLGRYTYVQTYLHMIPILLAEYHLRPVKNGLVRYALVGLVGMSGTWLCASVIYAGIGILQTSVQKIKRFFRW